MHGVFEPPQARTGRVHLDVEAVGIGNFVDAIPWFEGPDLNIAKRHGSTPLKGLGPAPLPALEATGQSSKTHPKKRSEERRVGKECGGKCSNRWSPEHKNKQQRT